MKGLHGRLAALEGRKGNDPEMRLLLDSLSLEELARLEELLVNREAGRWVEIQELGDADLRLLARIKLVEAA